MDEKLKPVVPNDSFWAQTFFFLFYDALIFNGLFFSDGDRPLTEFGNELFRNRIIQGKSTAANDTRTSVTDPSFRLTSATGRTDRGTRQPSC